MSRQEKKEKAKKRKISVRRIFLLALVSLLLGGNIYLWNAKTLVKNQMPMPFGYGMSIVLSGSMEPVLSVDDLVLIRKSAGGNVGDIIVYESGDGMIIHRVISRDGEMLTTKGDANNIADEPISISNVKGKMIARIPKAGKIVRILKKPSVVLILFVLALLLMEWSYRKEQEEDSVELEAIKEEIRRLKKEQQRNQ